MKKVIKITILTILICIFAVFAVSCTEALGFLHKSCVDANGDLICDSCGKNITPAICATHTDFDGNGVCEVCATAFSKKMEGISFQDRTFTYDGNEKTIEVLGAPSGAVIEYDVPNVQTNAGEYEITATVRCEGYELTELSATMKIRAATIEIRFPERDGAFLPNGKAPKIGYTLDGVLDGDEVLVTFDFGDYKFDKEGIFEATAISENPNYKIKAIDATISVRFANSVHTVSFDTGLENRTIDPEEVMDGETIEAPRAPSNYGYELVGWYFGDTEWDFSDPVTMNMALTAKWKLAEHSIIYILDGGKNSELNPGFYTMESELTIQSPTKDGYVFHGWYSDSEFTTPADPEIKKGSHGRITLYANWSCDNTIAIVEKRDPTPTTEGYIKTNCTVCHSNEKTEILPVTDSIKLLAIGNSFSVDALEYLYKLLEDAGIEDILIVNLYKGGCSIDTHYNSAIAGSEIYTLYISDSDSGKMVSQSGIYNLEYAMTLEDWDIITMQQASSQSYQSAKYENVENLVNYVKGYQPEAKLYWHMTWAYDTYHLEDTDNKFENSLEMYEGIVGAVSENILTSDSFSLVIPVGTAIQNLRTSHLGDSQTRDGYHLNKGVGRYTAALTWLKFMYDIDLADITYTPSSYPEIAENLDVIKEAVNNAYLNPYEVTDSVISR